MDSIEYNRCVPRIIDILKEINGHCQIQVPVSTDSYRKKVLDTLVIGLETRPEVKCYMSKVVDIGLIHEKAVEHFCHFFWL